MTKIRKCYRSRFSFIQMCRIQSIFILITNIDLKMDYRCGFYYNYFNSISAKRSIECQTTEDCVLLLDIIHVCMLVFWRVCVFERDVIIKIGSCDE